MSTRGTIEGTKDEGLHSGTEGPAIQKLRGMLLRGVLEEQWVFKFLKWSYVGEVLKMGLKKKQIRS